MIEIINHGDGHYTTENHQYNVYQLVTPDGKKTSDIFCIMLGECERVVDYFYGVTFIGEEKIDKLVRRAIIEYEEGEYNG